ncbi:MULTISPECIES: hypothetical protein [Burkholderia cepacia complex]|nr:MULTISPECIES: hypothetical protein [Burkholderia cepacia complex]
MAHGSGQRPLPYVPIRRTGTPSERAGHMTGVSPATQDGADDSARVDPVPAQPRAGDYAVDGLDGVRWRVGKTVIRDAQGNAGQTRQVTRGGARVSRHVLRTNQVRLAVPSSAR